MINTVKLSIILSLLFISIEANDIPSGVELQKMVDEMRKAYGMIDTDDSRQKYDINKKVTDKELKEQVDKMNKILREHPKLQYQYGK